MVYTSVDCGKRWLICYLNKQQGPDHVQIIMADGYQIHIVSNFSPILLGHS